MKPYRAEDEYSYPLHMQGSASSGTYAEEDDTVRRLREVVKEVTGKAVETPVKARIGFLP